MDVDVMVVEFADKVDELWGLVKALHYQSLLSIRGMAAGERDTFAKDD